MYLSKSIYVQVWNCPKGAWIQKYHPEMVTVSPDQQARFDAGHEVGELAQGMFGPFTDVTAYKVDGSLDKSQMIRNTAEEMAKGTPVICEAAFAFEGLYCAVDLLRKDGDGWAIYEVKSSSHLQDYYTADVSYQKYVLEHCGVKVTGVYLVNIDTSYVLGEDGVVDPAGYFRINDLWEEASQAQAETVPELLETAERVLGCGDEPAVDLAEGCMECAHFEYCTRELPSPNVFGLYRLAKKKMIEYYRKGLVSYLFHCYSSVPLATGRFQPADAWFNPFSRKTSIGKTSTLESSGLFDTASSYVIMMSRSKPDMHAEALIKLSISRPDDCSFNWRQT